jgi:hypothetical protein
MYSRRKLGNIADHVTVILPWGSLLHAIATSDIASLLQIARLCSSGASIEIVFSYDPERDGQEGARLGLADLNEKHIRSMLPEIYRQVGLEVVCVEAILQQELSEYETTWAKRLALGRRRNVWRILATRNK